jgi:hypothetical protein
MPQIRFYILLVCFISCFAEMNAQYYNDDAKLWLYVKLDKDLSQKLNAELSIQNRIENNISQYSKLYGNLQLSYKINKNFRVIAGYGYGKNDRSDGSYGDRNRGYAGIILRKKVKSFVFSYRNIFQVSIKDNNTSEKGGAPLYFDRNKFTIKYELNKRLEFYAAQELNLSYYQADYDNIARSRTYIGAIYNLSKKSSVEGYFMFQKHFKYVNQAKRDFIFGLTYSHSF